ncbi:exopolyphosphatase / guanosine-5'-triphosphate,3'-diphosphate pyrophosphatase [Propionispira arboris]|uniref:Exopolyphosphatase / guanosine-5'-triphosphate,3'-diphosphate pyrophosphatase n=2 Tax=Propionispira arboris TaxID=84035 RepID=A0A1H6ZDN9_9FIRM|nr:exopolyphosphatase / guanosine-5'-triphosphate,3'-diphosphate pyrophosphatase [Propionispira arboris]
MVHAIIDIGSNSIRLAIYKVDEDQLTILLNKKYTAGLAAYVKNEEMTQVGIDKTCEVLDEFKVLLDAFHITNVSAFATAALRNISNSAAAIEQITKKTGVVVTVLSGTEEATLDFIGATHATQTKTGLLLDIGGASTELVLYEDGLIVNAVSLPIGSLNAYGQYVHYLLPNKSERKAIKEAVLAELSKITDLDSAKQAFVCGVGGSIRAAGKINNYLFNLPLDTDEIKAPNVKKMIKLLENDEEDDLISSETLNILLKTVPDRIETILPGMIILHTLIKYFKSETIVVSKSGVREGYLYKNIIFPKKTSDKSIPTNKTKGQAKGEPASQPTDAQKVRKMPKAAKTPRAPKIAKEMADKTKPEKIEQEKIVAEVQDGQSKES